jgi:hypothetical protein
MGNIHFKNLLKQQERTAHINLQHAFSKNFDLMVRNLKIFPRCHF